MIRNIVRDPRGFLALRWRMFVANLFAPDEFYDNYLSKHGLKFEVLVVLIIGAIGSVGFYFGVQEILSEFALGAETDINPDQPPMDQNTARQVRSQILHPIIGIALLWLYYATVYYLGSWFFSGHGTFYRLIKNTAWALVPMAVANLVLTVGMVYTFNGLEIEARLPGLPQRNVAFLFDQAYTQLPMILVPLVKIAVLAWVAYIGAAAISDAMKLPKERSLRIAAVASALHAGYLLWTALGRAGVV